MIDHITFGVTDFARAVAFYDATFAPLGVRRLFDVPSCETDGELVTGYGDTRPWFWIAGRKDGSAAVHIALTEQSRSQVDAFYVAGLRAGGTDNGAPGVRPHYHAEYYAAFVFDPDGNNIEAVCHAAEVSQ